MSVLSCLSFKNRSYARVWTKTYFRLESSSLRNFWLTTGFPESYTVCAIEVKVTKQILKYSYYVSAEWIIKSDKHLS